MRLRFKLNAPNKGLKALFGELEAEIMEILWEKGPLKGREIFEEMGRKRKIAYTTVLTVLDRLSKKGFIKKQKDVGSIIFVPSISKKDFQVLVTDRLIRGAIDISEDLAISAFLDIFSKMDTDKIEKLTKFIEEKINEKNKNY